MDDTSQNIKNKPFYSDLSFWSLIIANSITIFWAWKEGWPLETMVWVYFLQNIILGIFWPAKVFESTIDGSYAKKVRSVTIFLPHYFLMHFIYATSLFNFTGYVLPTNFKHIITMAGIFLLSETVSYFAGNRLSDTKPLSLAKVQLFPYARVIPMNLVMFFGIMLEAGNKVPQNAVVFFLLLKALADIAMYMVERSSMFRSLVTYLVKGQEEKKASLGTSIFDEMQGAHRKDKQKVCRYCQRIVGENKKLLVIKEHGYCKECYDSILLP